MRVGLNMLLWTTNVAREHAPLFRALKRAGCDGVEVPLMGDETSRFRDLSKVLSDSGLGCTCSIVIPDEEHNPISADPAHRQGGLDFLKWAIDCAHALGSSLICGPFFQPLGAFSGVGPTEEEKERAAEVHRQAADVAAQAGVALAVEFLNRFECYFLNTLADAAAHTRRVGRPNFGALFDTFHANIEEKDPVGCIAKHVDVIKHVHVSENDRGTPGKGHVDWLGTFRALRSGGYDGWLVIEAFGRAFPDLAEATRIWRDLFPSAAEVYEQGVPFIRRQWEAAA